jgi:glycosyltransferase involved in cell wall biosynthesis
VNVLHLYSDWRWTGPAEPVLQTALGLQQRGHNVLVACCRHPEHETPHETIEAKAAEYGVHCTAAFRLSRYLGIGDTLHDWRKLPRFIRDEKIDIVHTHLSHDHGLGAACTKRMGSGRPVLVRTLHRRSALKKSLMNKVLLNRLTDGLLTFTDGFRQQYVDRFAIDPAKIRTLPMVIDTARFRPGRDGSKIRDELGIPAGNPVIGLVSRFQKYRRLEVFLEAARIVVDKVPEARFVLLGGSSQMQETVFDPLQALGLEKYVIFGGYRMADYVETLAAFDIFSLLMPGFDGTARAVREALAMGIPCVVSDYGMLPDIVRHGETGLVAELAPAPLAAAWLELIQNRERRIRLGEAAREDAVTRFDFDGMAVSLESSYETWLQARGASE